MTGSFRHLVTLSSCHPVTLSTWLLLLERIVERHGRWCKIKPAHQRECFGGALVAIHSVVFPFDREWPLVVDIIQRAEDTLERHAAATRRHEVPAAPMVAEEQVRAENAIAPIQIADRLLDVYMVDPVFELIDELDWVDHLPVQVAGVE